MDGEWRSYWITLAILSVLGVVASLVIGVVMVMGTDGCLASDHQNFICSQAGEQTVFWLPWAGWIGAIVSSAATAGVAARRHGSPWLGILIGGLIYVVAVVVDYSIVAP